MTGFALSRVGGVQAVVLSLIAALSLTACGSDSTSLESVKVTGGKSPTVKVKNGFTSDKTSTRVVAEGKGDKLESGDVVKLNYVAVNGRTGKQFDNSYKAGKPFTVSLKNGSILAGFVKGLTGQRVGSRVLVAIPPADGFNQDQQTLGLEKNDTMVFLFDIVAKIPTKAMGKTKKIPATVPKLVIKDGVPSGFKKSSKTASAPKKGKAFVAIEGTGAPIEKDQTLTVQYVGQVYPQGTIFDSSWERGESTSFPLSGVIACWQQLLPGKKLGSRVILECPADIAYGDKGTPDRKIKPGDTLLFAIDLLDAS